MKLWKLLYAFFVLQSIAQNLFSQSPEWITYTAGDNATCIAEEGNYIWAGINKDLVRLNKITGEKIFFNKANSGLPANDYSAIAIDKQGNKWIGTSHGIVKYNGTTWQVFNKTNSGFPGGTIKSICIDAKNTKWIAIPSLGLVKFNDTTWTIYNAANTGNVLGTIRAMCTDKKNNKWFATSKGVVKFNDSIWSTHPRYGFNGGSTEVLTIAIDSLGWVWSADINSYIAKFQNNGADSVWVLVKRISFSNWVFNYPISMAVDKNGYCWVGYLSGVVVKANADGRTDYNLADPMKSQNTVNAIHIDK
ncbi:MAG: hypothetical protein HY965_03025, partial [Ignavibacteriales bacterium]|nr:hypothetical protein [Ignavibacteriales bacterium]